MASLTRMACIPRAFLTVTRNHVYAHARYFASEIPPDNTASVPALYSKKPKVQKSKSTPKPGQTARSNPAPENIPAPEPQSRAQHQSQFQEGANETSEEPGTLKEYIQSEPPLPLRRSNIEIDRENHGLSAFYRKVQVPDSSPPRWRWVSVEPKDPMEAHSGG